MTLQRIRETSAFPLRREIETTPAPPATAKRTLSLLLPGLCLALSLVLLPAAHAADARASVQNPTMQIGQTNTYSITIRNTSHSGRISPPSVPGLVFATTPSTRPPPALSMEPPPVRPLSAGTSRRSGPAVLSFPDGPWISMDSKSPSTL